MEKCPRCDEYAKGGDGFCGACGRRVERPSSFLRIALLISCIVGIVILFFEYLCLLINTPGILDIISDYLISIFIIAPNPVVLFRITGIENQIYWILIVIALVACFAFALYKFAKVFTDRKGVADLDAAENTGMFWVSISLPAMLLINFVILFFVIILGGDVYSPFTPESSDLETMFEVAAASVWEEIITRMLFIGVPMAIVSLAITRKKESLKCLLGGFGMSNFALILMVFSAVVFGIAHFEGWGQYWKVLSTAIMGFFLGYVFVRFGLYAAILLHFMNNYLTAFDWLGLSALEVMIPLVLIALGIAAWFFIIKRLAASKEKIVSMPWFFDRYSQEGSDP